MNRTLALALALSLFACKKKEESKAAPPAPATATGDTAATAAPPPAIDAAPPAKTGPELMAVLGDANASPDARREAAEAIVEGKVRDLGPQLVALGNAEKDSMLQSDIYEAAGASGGAGTFEALIAEYQKALGSLDDDRDIPLRGGLKAFPTESVAWAKDNLPKAKKDHTAYADLITDSAQAGDLPVVVELLGKTKDVMAKNRLAAKAIELGDASKANFDVFVAGLKSKDEYDRSDTANFLANVADKVPADMKAQLIELLQKGKEGDQGGMTSMGYDEALKKLGAP